MCQSAQSLIDFTTSAIEDTQGIIRSIDTKISAIMIIVVLPATRIFVVVSCIKGIVNQWGFAGYAVSAFFAVSWLMMIVLCVLSISYTTVPKGKVVGKKPKLGYYITMRKGESLNSEVYNASAAVTCDDIVTSLRYEHLKLSVIRYVKKRRLEKVIICLAVWLVFGAVIVVGVSL